ncbi:hypothetical protein H0H81_000650 [Sphagnurus paluster]|uniref:non-specific serine/threonine protein kinase n=1 Tax=Sphagnurus paluster TaxID=117069 RepID=A0A9P7G271_9AGAR|nr:hypothetical protein H0H81_000650 [Sphagnurus paluster]
MSRIAPFVAPRSSTKFLVNQQVGHGHIGQVFKARDVRSKKVVTLKASLDGGKASFLVPLLASFHDSVNYYLVTEFFGGNDLAIRIGSSGKFTDEQARFYAAELVATLEELREKGIIHRDIKPAKIMFTPEGRLRLTDFGSAKKFYGGTTPLIQSSGSSFFFDVQPEEDSGIFVLPDIEDAPFTAKDTVGTPAYMAPELHLGKPYSFEVDIHSAGLPFAHGCLAIEDIKNSVLDGVLTFQDTDGVSEVAQDPLKRMLGKNRMSLEDIKGHPYFHNVPWDRVERQTLLPPYRPFIPVSSMNQKVNPFPIGEKYIKATDPKPHFSYASSRLLDGYYTVPSKAKQVALNISSLMDKVTGLNTLTPLDLVWVTPLLAKLPHVSSHTPPTVVSSPVPILLRTSPSVSTLAPEMQAFDRDRLLPYTEGQSGRLPQLSPEEEVPMNLKAPRGRLPSREVRAKLLSRPKSKEARRTAEKLEEKAARTPFADITNATGGLHRHANLRRPSRQMTTTKTLESRLPVPIQIVSVCQPMVCSPHEMVIQSISTIIEYPEAPPTPLEVIDSRKISNVQSNRTTDQKSGGIERALPPRTLSPQLRQLHLPGIVKARGSAPRNSDEPLSPAYSSNLKMESNRICQSGQPIPTIGPKHKILMKNANTVSKRDRQLHFEHSFAHSILVVPVRRLWVRMSMIASRLMKNWTGCSD